MLCCEVPLPFHDNSSYSTYSEGGGVGVGIMGILVKGGIYIDNR